ncbi:hypothetical protein evm_008873 [Chilo suppressalis]|nr:hypothetical protein evm_008873 [Chilo suppressalis]
MLEGAPEDGDVDAAMDVGVAEEQIPLQILFHQHKSGTQAVAGGSGSGTTTKKIDRRDSVVARSTGPSRNVINVNNPDFDVTVSDSLDRLETLDSDDEDLNDIDDLVDGIPFITAAPRTVREQIADDAGLTLTETEILRLEEDTSDRHVRELVSSNDYFEFNWSEDRVTFTGEREVFTGVPGPTFPITDETRPVDIFYKMFDSDFIDMMVTETNRYVEQRISVDRQDSTKKCARPLRWQPTDRDEMLGFLAIMILQGLYPKVREEAYFSFDGFGTTPYFGRIMPYNRYHLLKAFQHFIDNDTTTDLTKLNKIRPVLDYLNFKFASLYKPAQEIAIVESLFKWHGRLSFSQKISSKAAQVGVKTYELCESSTGYLWRFFVYTGKDGPNRTDRTGQDRPDRPENSQNDPDHDRTDDGRREVRTSNATAKTVYDLIQPLLHKEHTLIMDNFYNSPLLARCLKRDGQTDVYGTLRLSREFVPESIRTLTKSDIRKAPQVCPSCRGGSRYDPLQSSPFTSTTDWQVAKIQEIQSQGISGTIPRSVEIELQGDLVGTACPGDVLSVTGIVQVRGESKGGEDGKRAARLLQLYIEAVSIHSQRNLSNPTLSFTLKDYYAIQEIHASENVFRLLVHSLCPTIFGHEAVKAGLILGLVGGTELENGPRSNPHVLIVGDPGLGKSQLLQAAAHAAPRGVYVCGASASAGGLTVALGRESGGDFALEAGALVLADKGVCCVDELDKMTAHHSSLLEAMEQRRVSVAKAGVVCSLSARATVLAAANPAGGSYNRAKTVAENLKINSALLSRFDLVFILLDQPDEKIDAMLSEHVLALHSGQKAKRIKITDANSSIITSQNDSESSLSERLRLKPNESIDTLPLVLLRKYIAYARRYVHPKLSTEAANVLQNFYLELRHNHQSNSQDGTPITTRQLEACIRLTQARARVDLREEANANDANDVISLVKHSLMDTFSDEYGNIQLSRSINGSGVSSRGKLKKFLEILTRRAHQLGKDVFTRKELIQIHKSAGVPGDAGDLIEAMHIHSYLLLKGSNTYQLIT